MTEPLKITGVWNTWPQNHMPQPQAHLKGKVGVHARLDVPRQGVADVPWLHGIRRTAVTSGSRGHGTFPTLAQASPCQGFPSLHRARAPTSSDEWHKPMAYLQTPWGHPTSIPPPPRPPSPTIAFPP